MRSADCAVRGWVTLPSYVEREELSAPDNVTLSGYVRHAAVMPHADLLVTHGGLGSIGAALTFGVPIVCMPEDRDQPVNAAMVARLGAGQSLDTDASPAAIGEAVERGLAGPRPDAAAARPGAGLRTARRPASSLTQAVRGRRHLHLRGPPPGAVLLGRPVEPPAYRMSRSISSRTRETCSDTVPESGPSTRSGSAGIS